MMAKHTAPPWKLVCYDDGKGRYQDGSYRPRKVIDIKAGTPSFPIVRVEEGEEMEANADLIIAAPDLLAALKSLKLDFNSRKVYGSPDICLAAINKAEGK